MLLYSPFAFASARLEKQYNTFLAQKVGPRARTLLIMTTFFWTVGVVQAFSVTNPNPLAVISAVCTLCVSAGALYLQTGHLQQYMACWPVVHFVVHMMHVITHMAVRSVPTNVYRAPGAAECANPFRCIQEVLLVFPHLGAGLVASTGIILPFLLQISVQASIFFVSVLGNTRLCETAQGLSGMLQNIQVPGVYTVVQHAVSRGVTEAAHPQALPICDIRLAFWGIQVGVISVMVTLLCDVLSRRQFLAKHPELIGPRGANRAAQWPFGSIRSINNIVALAFGVTASDILLFEAVVLYYARMKL
jgi:hypothetical protein